MKVKKRYAMAIDLNRCIGCDSCTVACKMENDVPLGVWRIWVNRREMGTYPRVSRAFLPVLCNHCDNPICVYVCPVKATYRRKQDGVVVVDPHLCIGCKICMVACPYQMRYLDPIKRVAQKCDFCLHRVQAGLNPACVEGCPAGVMIFGDLNDPQSPVAKLLSAKPAQRLKTSYGTYPQVFYLGKDVSVLPFEKGGSIYDKRDA
jgi:tetrathionate reductase subunit B